MTRNGLWMNESGAVSYKETAPDSFILTPFGLIPASRMTRRLVVESCLASRGWFGNFVLTGMRSEWQNDQEMKGMKTWRKGFLYWMTEWWRNEGDFRIKGFALLQKMSLISPSFGHSVSFLNDETDWSEVKIGENDWNALWMISLLCYFSFHSKLVILKWWRNDRMRGNEGVFGSGEKKWSQKNLSFHCHSVIPASFNINDLKCPIEWHRNDQEWPLNEWIRCCLL